MKDPQNEPPNVNGGTTKRKASATTMTGPRNRAGIAALSKEYAPVSQSSNGFVRWGAVRHSTSNS